MCDHMCVQHHVNATVGWDDLAAGNEFDLYVIIKSVKFVTRLRFFLFLD